MRVVAIDMGFARVGFASGETLVGIAFPKETITYADYLPYLKKLVANEKVEKIILGNPESLFTDELSDHQEKIFDEKERIEKELHIPVEMWNEQFTTQLAERQLVEIGIQGKAQKGKKDALAACAMLQEFFDKGKGMPDYYNKSIQEGISKKVHNFSL